jgi:hypothetical protein
MILLDSATVLQLVTTVAGIHVDANWVDLTGNGQAALVAPDFEPFVTPAPGTFTIAPAPPVTTPTTMRSVQYVSLSNQSGSSAIVTVQKFNGVAFIDQSITLPAGYTLIYNEDSGWDVYDTTGRRLVNALVLSAGIAAISAGTQIGSTGTIVLSNANNVSFGMAGSSVVTASAGFNLSAGTTSNVSSAFTFANSNGVSFGLDAGIVTASVATAAAAATVSVFSQDADFVTHWPVSQAALSMQKLSIAMNLSATQLAFVAALSAFATATDALTVSHAVYTLSAGTAKLASSASRVLSFTTGTATTASSVYGGASGTRYRTIGVSYAITPGDYVFGWWISTANGMTASVFGRAAMNLVGTFDGVETATFLNGLSTSTVAVLPASFAVTDTGYVRTGFSALRQPGAILFGTN